VIDAASENSGPVTTPPDAVAASERQGPSARAAPHAVQATDVSIEYRDDRQGTHVLAVEELTLTVPRRAFVSIIGPSGCGKSTFLRSIGDLNDHVTYRGQLLVNGKSPVEARRQNDLAFVFQDPVLLPWRRVIENVRLPLEVIPRERLAAADGRSPEEMVSLVGLDGFSNALPRQLSGGMRQRVAIARALTMNPSILLMDEPFGALDEISRERMNMELLRIWGATETSVVFVTHSIPEAVFLSDVVAVMSSRPGRIKALVSISLPRPRDAQLKRTEAFLDLENQVRDALGA
jgi:NitT/TauT family transport system ATP-binding protein